MHYIFTATAERTEIAELWSAAINATLIDEHRTVTCHQFAPPRTGNLVLPMMVSGQSAMQMVQLGPMQGLGYYIEEDMIPVRPWSLSDYPGDFLEGQFGSEYGSDTATWPGFWFSRTPFRAGKHAALVPQRLVRNGGCPEWLPAELCQPALDANAKVLGSHFLHIDKAYYTRGGDYAAKQVLLQRLQEFHAEALSRAVVPTPFDPTQYVPEIEGVGGTSYGTTLEPPRAFGPGTELKKLLSRIGITATPNCKCNARAAYMDQMEAQEPGWCEANLDEIVGWLREEAADRGLPFLDAAGRLLVRRAIANARRAASS